jgi:hypothetical protein
MAATELTTRGSTWPGKDASDRGGRAVDLRTICLCWVALVAATALGAVLAVAAPALAPATAPHPTLHPSAGEVASILTNNLRVLAAPFILVVARFERTRASRLAGDTIVATILAGNGITVGLALGRWQSALIGFVPQLPVEYLAAATAAAAWLDARRHRAGTVLTSGAATIVLTAAAAVIEVLLTPHAR